MLSVVAASSADSVDSKDFRAKHGRDLYMTDIDEYDRICKVGVFAAVPLLSYFIHLVTRAAF